MTRAVIFDMDGVLTDSEPVINAAAIAGLREYGIDPKPEDFAPFVGAGEDRYIGGVAAKYGLRYVPEMKRRVYEIYLQILPGMIRAFPGVHDLLRALRQRGVRLALASSADRIKVEANLRAIGVDPGGFDALVVGEDVEHKKPAPDIFLAAAHRLGVAPGECCVVEDAVNGVRAAKAAGMRCVAVEQSFAAAVLAPAGPDAVCPTLAAVTSADLGLAPGSPPRRLRVGVVGAGTNTCTRHIPGLQAIPGVEIVAVANRSLESGARVAARFGIPRVAANWHEVVGAQDIDAVVIGTWPYLHCEVTCAALEAGKHVLCEARMAMDLAEAQRMLEASRRHPELVAQLVPSPMTLAVDATICRYLSEGRLGRLLCVDVADHVAGFPDYGAPLHWREDRSRSGLNVMSLGIWYEAVLRWLGPAESVFATGANLVRERRDPATGSVRALDIPDWLTVSARLPDGVAVQFSIRNVGGLAPRHECVLTGDEATLRCDGEHLWYGRRGAAGLQPVDIPAAERGGWQVEADFVAAIRGAAPVRLTTFADGVRYMAFTQAVADSLASGQVRAVAKEGMAP
jgi:HAD superfamily hydrolase (TIGR01509 family)